MQLKKKKRKLAAVLLATGAAKPAPITQSLMAAALAMPGMLAHAPAQAESAPDKSTVAFKFQRYQDYQPSGKRIRVNRPAFYVSAPIKETYSVDASYAVDSVSGASPLFHSTLSGASGLGISDRRQSGDFKLTRYNARGAFSAGAAVSREDDYDSNAANLGARFSSADNNTTFALGLGYASDKIGEEGNPARNESRRTWDFLIGLTKILSINDLIQSNFTYAKGDGFFSDPYKPNDRRPSRRDQWAWLTRHVHYFSGPGAALHSSYRYYSNDWDVSAHTLEAAWLQPVGRSWLIEPSLRYHSQRAANFYVDQVPPVGINNTFYTADQRLSAFGAITAGIKVVKNFPKDLSVDVAFARYKQQSSWRIGGDGSPGLEDFNARWWEVGVSKKF